MKGRNTGWIVGVVGAVLIAVAFSWAQSERPGTVDLETIYALWVTETGENRLDRMERMIEEIEREVDLIHSVALRMLEEQYGFFDTSQWSLDDIKYALDRLGLQLDQVRMKTDCIPCP